MEIGKYIRLNDICIHTLKTKLKLVLYSYFICFCIYMYFACTVHTRIYTFKRNISLLLSGSRLFSHIYNKFPCSFLYVLYNL